SSRTRPACASWKHSSDPRPVRNCTKNRNTNRHEFSRIHTNPSKFFVFFIREDSCAFVLIRVLLWGIGARGYNAPMRAIVTGQVGVDKGPYLETLQKCARKAGHDMVVCHVGKMMYA